MCNSIFFKLNIAAGAFTLKRTNCEQCTNLQISYESKSSNRFASHFFFGVGLESALDPERPFSVLSIPDDVTRHSLLQGGRKRK